MWAVTVVNFSVLCERVIGGRAVLLVTADAGDPTGERIAVLRRSLRRWYHHAVRRSGVVPVAEPEIDILDGQDDGPVTFVAVVAVA